MSAPRTLYEILDVAPEASLPDLEAGYQRALEVFADDSLASYALFAPDEAERIRREIQVAFAVLRHPHSRTAYDAALAAANDKAEATLSFTTTYDCSNAVSISDSSVAGTPVRPAEPPAAAGPVREAAEPAAAPAPTAPESGQAAAPPEPPPPVVAAPTPAPAEPPAQSPPLPNTSPALARISSAPPLSEALPPAVPPPVASAPPAPVAAPGMASPPVLVAAAPAPVPAPAGVVMAAADDPPLPPPGPPVVDLPPPRQVLSDLPPLAPPPAAAEAPAASSGATPSWVPVSLSTELPIAAAAPTTPPLPVSAATPLPGPPPSMAPAAPATPPPAQPSALPAPAASTAPPVAHSAPPRAAEPPVSSPPRFKRVRLDDGQSAAQVSRAAPPTAVVGARADSIVGLPEKGEISGSLLRQLREARSLDLKTMADVTKISTHYLRAIEANQLGELPGRVYLRGFLLQYARALRLPPERVVAGYLAFAEQHFRSQIR